MGQWPKYFNKILYCIVLYCICVNFLLHISCKGETSFYHYSELVVRGEINDKGVKLYI